MVEAAGLRDKRPALQVNSGLREFGGSQKNAHWESENISEEVKRTQTEVCATTGGPLIFVGKLGNSWAKR